MLCNFNESSQVTLDQMNPEKQFKLLLTFFSKYNYCVFDPSKYFENVLIKFIKIDLLKNYPISQKTIFSSFFYRKKKIGGTWDEKLYKYEIYLKKFNHNNSQFCCWDFQLYI